jgi:TolA-binding protein
VKLPLPAFALIAIGLSTPLVSAQNGPPPGTDPDEQLSQIQKDMNGMLQQIAKLQQQSQLQESIHQMQHQIDQLQKTTDPKERQKLIHEHLHTLQTHLKLIQSLSEAEGGSGNRTAAPPNVPARASGPGGMSYGPGPMGFPGGMRYGPGMMGAPPGYPGGMVGPGRAMGYPSSSARVPTYP